ncbi:MAG: DUF2975 domain-containing protein [Arenicella sp.]|nr:DUF2975 domain-containing protein [Arenicella sp.]
MHANKLKRLSTLMSMICAVLIFALPMVTIWFWINFQSNAQLLFTAQQGVLQLETIRPWQIICAGAISVTTTLVVVYGLIQLRQLFEHFKSDNFFTKASVRSLHRFCLALFVSAILKVLNTAVLSVLLTFNNGPNQKAFIVSFGSNEFWLLFIAATFLTIAWCFKEGLALANENASFV